VGPSASVDHEEGSLGPNLRAAIDGAMLPVREHRGLMSLEEALTRLSGLSVYREGRGDPGAPRVRWIPVLAEPLAFGLPGFKVAHPPR
jgi:hypothetical protein